jgi:hypothetical protein
MKCSSESRHACRAKARRRHQRGRARIGATTCSSSGWANTGRSVRAGDWAGAAPPADAVSMAQAEARARAAADDGAMRGTGRSYLSPLGETEQITPTTSSGVAGSCYHETALQGRRYPRPASHAPSRDAGHPQARFKTGSRPRCVVERSRCPASSWIARTGAPRIARCEQNVCAGCARRCSAGSPVAPPSAAGR